MTPVSNAVRIGILGDFNPKFRSHPATTEALQHAAHKLDLKLESESIPTPSLTTPGAEKILESSTASGARPGSPYKSFDGMLKGIKFARRRDWPCLGNLRRLSVRADRVRPQRARHRRRRRR